MGSRNWLQQKFDDHACIRYRTHIHLYIQVPHSFGGVSYYRSAGTLAGSSSSRRYPKASQIPEPREMFCFYRTLSLKIFLRVNHKYGLQLWKETGSRDCHFFLPRAWLRMLSDQHDSLASSASCCCIKVSTNNLHMVYDVVAEICPQE